MSDTDNFQSELEKFFEKPYRIKLLEADDHILNTLNYKIIKNDNYFTIAGFLKSHAFGELSYLTRLVTGQIYRKNVIKGTVKFYNEYAEPVYRSVTFLIEEDV